MRSRSASRAEAGRDNAARMEQREWLEALELLAGAVGYLCKLQSEALRDELELPPEERRHAIGELTNDRDVLVSFARQALALRDRAQAVRRA
jgi:hypothetical protein